MYDKASLALIPSGYKGGSVNKVYSVLPSNGDGDFYHSRSSIATRVNKDGLIESVGYAPRLDYTGNVDCPHLLLEPNRTNILLYSEDISNSAWTTFASGETIVSDSVISPNGTQTADTLEGDGSATNVYIRQNITLNTSVDYTFSVFAKKGTNNFIALSAEGFTGVTNTLVFFDLDNGTVTSGTADIEDYGNGWFRCSYKVTIGTDGTGRFLVFAAYNGTTRAFPSTLEANGQNIYLWGAQAEQGSYATSYIPTLQNQAETRTADICNNAGTSAEFNDSEGVLFAEVEFLDNVTTGYISVSDGTADNRCIIYSAANQIVVATKSGGSGISKSATGTPTNLNKIAVAYSSSGSKFFLNGSNETGTGSFSTTPRVFAANTLDQINFDISDGSNDLYARVKQVIYFNEALSDSELQTLTS